MGNAYDPVPDATAFLATRAPAQRHAIVRLLATGNEHARALPVLRWVIAQDDCDLATAAMTYWRLRAAPAGADGTERQDIIDLIARRADAYPGPAIAWDGLDVWTRTPLIAGGAPARLSGPFGATQAGPAGQAFLDVDHADDDIFDSLWQVAPAHADLADWLAGRPGQVWLTAIDDLAGSHAGDIYDWMRAQPECTAPVAAKLDRGGWYDAPRALIDDFDYWCASTSLGGLVPRPRGAAEAAWQAAKRNHAVRQTRRQAIASAATMPRSPGLLDGLFYGGPFTDTQAQMDRCWRQFNVVMALGAALLVAVMRGPRPMLGFWVFLALTGVMSVYLSSAKMGHPNRKVFWLIGATALAFALAFVFRAIDGRH